VTLATLGTMGAALLVTVQLGLVLLGGLAVAIGRTDRGEHGAEGVEGVEG